MTDLYSILETEKSVSQTDIKRAYFVKVREYPPDRYPVEFKKVREAYEILINERTRKQYDAYHDMPEIFKMYYNSGKDALENHEVTRAIGFLEQAHKASKGYPIIMSLLGQAYMENGNNGKATKIYEDLVKNESDNAGFVGSLANAYLDRGWHKKAITAYKRALELDQDNVSLWLGLMNAFMDNQDIGEAVKTIEEGIAVSQKNGWDNLNLYFNLLMLDIMHNQYNKYLEKHLNELTKRQLSESEKSNAGFFITELAEMCFMHDKFSIASLFINAAEKLIPSDNKIKELRNRIRGDQAIHIAFKEFEEDDTFDKKIKGFFGCVLQACKDEECCNCQKNIFSFEAMIFGNLDYYRSEIIKIKNLYPEVYNLKKEYCDMAIDKKKVQALHRFIDKKYMELSDEYDDEDDEDEYEYDEDDDDDDYDTSFYDFEVKQPYVREEPKVGRNDPCPCGSGKKYKKCCG